MPFAKNLPVVLPVVSVLYVNSSEFDPDYSRRMLPASSPDGQPIDLQRRNTHTYRHRLPVFAAYTDALIELKIAAHHGYLGQDIRPVADQGRVLQRSGHFA